jgi:hypothetical protein
MQKAFEEKTTKFEKKQWGMPELAYPIVFTEG